MLKVAIIGAGYMGETHADVYVTLPEVRLAGIVSRRMESAEKLANKYREKYKVEAYTDVEEALKDDSISLIDICYPTFLHQEYVEKAARKGKNIFCEKPIALTLKDADSTIKAIKEAGVKFMLAHVVRFWPEFAKAKKILDSKELGEILSVSAIRIGPPSSHSSDDWLRKQELSGGAIIDFNIHDIDYILWLLGKPRAVFARGLRSKLGAWDHMFTTLEFNEGKVAFTETSYDMPKGYPYTQSFRILCESGCIEYHRWWDKTLRVYRPGKEVEYPEVSKEDPYCMEIEYFVNCLREDKEPTIGTVEEGRLALEVALAAIQSAETEKVVNLS